jgi:hypothetical protein
VGVNEQMRTSMSASIIIRPAGSSRAFPISDCAHDVIFSSLRGPSSGRSQQRSQAQCLCKAARKGPARRLALRVRSALARGRRQARARNHRSHRLPQALRVLGGLIVPVVARLAPAPKWNRPGRRDRPNPWRLARRPLSNSALQ